jgi:transposase
VVCDPRKAALLKEGNKSDRIDARKLAESLRTNQLKPVYHGEHGIRTLKELGRSYATITKDLTRVMNRIKALYRSWAIPCSGSAVYAPRHRAEWLGKIVEPGVRIRAEHLYQQLDSLQAIRLEARRELLRESQKHAAVKRLRQIPAIGPIRAALLVALLQTHTVSAPSAGSGPPTAASRSKLTTAASTDGYAANCSATGSASPCAA